SDAGRSNQVAGSSPVLGKSGTPSDDEGLVFGRSSGQTTLRSGFATASRRPGSPPPGMDRLPPPYRPQMPSLTRRASLVALLLLTVAAEPIGAQVPLSPRAFSLGGAMVAGARGHEAIYINP